MYFASVSGNTEMQKKYQILNPNHFFKGTKNSEQPKVFKYSKSIRNLNRICISIEQHNFQCSQMGCTVSQSGITNAMCSRTVYTEVKKKNDFKP